MDKEKIIYELVWALKFYRDGFSPSPNKRYGGMEYKPTEYLLDDCGNIAMEAISKAERIYPIK